MLITIPYPWVFAFYQNVLVQDYREKKSLREITGRTSSLNNFRHQQNYLAISILSLFQLFVLLNTGVALYTLPFLLKIFTGIETVVTMGGFSYFNSTFLITALALTYLCTDPIIKTVYTLRLFYADSEKTGADLKADLKRIKAKSGLIIVFFFLVIPILIHPDNSFGNTGDASNNNKNIQKAYNSSHGKMRHSRSATEINPETLNKSIEEVLNRREFAWRAPDPKDNDSYKQGLIGNFIDWLRPYVESGIKTLKKWGDSFATWIESLLPDSETKNSEKKNDSGVMIKYFLFALLALTAGILLFAIIKILLFKNRAINTEDNTVSVVPDISDENIKADDMPADHWMELALTLADKGDFRLSMRALYLGTLARLAETRLITIARYKSNREYENELSRRFHENKEIIQTFSETVNVFDRVWYGVHNITREDIDLFAENQMRIVTFANQ